MMLEVVKIDGNVEAAAVDAVGLAAVAIAVVGPVTIGFAGIAAVTLLPPTAARMIGVETGLSSLMIGDNITPPDS